MSKQDHAERWSQIAADFDQIGPPFFADTGRRLVELIQLPQEAVVLDVAAGRGAVLFPAANRAGVNGRIFSIDLASGMIHRLAEDVKDGNIPQVFICQMDAERLAFADASFDAVLCAHAIFYFPQAIDAFHRILRPGGCVGLSIVAQGTFNWLWQVFERYSDTKEPSTQDEPAINSPDGLLTLLERAGFENLQLCEETLDCVYADEEAWWTNLWALGTRRTLEKMAPETRQGFKSDLFAALKAFQQADGFHIPHRTLFAWGMKSR